MRTGSARSLGLLKAETFPYRKLVTTPGRRIGQSELHSTIGEACVVEKSTEPVEGDARYAIKGISAEWAPPLG